MIVSEDPENEYPENEFPEYGWLWFKRDDKLQKADGEFVTVGSKLEANEKLKRYSSDVFAQDKIYDSFSGVEGPIVARVRYLGKTSDTFYYAPLVYDVLWMADATPVLKQYVIWCAERALHGWEKKYPENNVARAAIDSAKNYLMGKATREETLIAAKIAHDAAENELNCAREELYEIQEKFMNDYYKDKNTPFPSNAVALNDRNKSAEHSIFAASYAAEFVGSQEYDISATHCSSYAASGVTKSKLNNKLKSMIMKLKPKNKPNKYYK
jgi:hypothetical protein